MRSRFLLPLSALALIACSQATIRAQQCQADSDCASGDACVNGSCTPLAPDSGVPDAGSPAPDAGTDAGAPDAGGPDAGLPDAGSDGGSVGYGGGTVDLLDFSLTGDTRPGFCDLVGNYPSAIIAQEVAQMAALPSQFAADLGDHMFACLPDLGPVMSTAPVQMQLYVDAVAHYPKPWFMTMGNHECLTQLDCSTIVGDDDPNFHTFLAALPGVSHQTTPYYSIDINTRFGLVRLVFIADNYGSSAAQAWLGSVLTDADAHAVHTIILKHHPYTGSDTGPAWPWPILAQHRITLMLTAHEHDYEHDTSALSGRTVICGLGGASTANTGFCRVQQQDDNSLAFTEYDINGNPLDTWSVPPLP